MYVESSILVFASICNLNQFPFSALDATGVRKVTEFSLPTQLKCLCSGAEEPGSEANQILAYKIFCQNMQPPKCVESSTDWSILVCETVVCVTVIYTVSCSCF